MKGLAILIGLCGLIAIAYEFEMMLESFPVDGYIAIVNFLTAAASAVIVFGTIALFIWADSKAE